MAEKETRHEVHKYIGKELKREGTTKDGVQWKVFKLKFDTGGQYPFTVDCFDTIGTKEDSKSITLKEMEEGNYYHISYNIEKEAFEAHGKKHDNRTAYFIKESSKEEAQQQTQPQQEQTKLAETKQETVIDPTIINAFLFNYNEQVPQEQKSLTHLLMVWFKNRHSEEADKLLPYFQAYVDKHVEVKKE